MATEYYTGFRTYGLVDAFCLGYTNDQIVMDYHLSLMQRFAVKAAGIIKQQVDR